MCWVLRRQAMLWQSLCGSTDSVGGGGRLRLTGDSGNAGFSSAVCFKGVRFFQCYVRVPWEIEKGYPDSLQVILMDGPLSPLLKFESGFPSSSTLCFEGSHALRSLVPSVWGVARAGFSAVFSSLRITCLFAVLVAWGVQEGGSVE